ncbi:hypothetical protein [Epilithonimonas arachidiradicis]|uniref:Uncharacterized protein n=1 Tax=Epilithonimonas arachidiradicis TaxID=1617282 RepID=A0A420DDY0_9FLAO|nr:hypothetical protein [Epilithonimonas arachidiradicis]RKE90110.1 hypothetical protein BXY58_0698 [Epilithonimonas arachidiradicis]GGG47820.1 hypothetical protein GCM10007332_06660 [Epilithonimonas arachidiradicis]
MSIKEIIDLFGKEKISEWVLEMPKFYISPSSFFKKLFGKNDDEKLSISIFYILITIGLTYIFSNDTFKNVTKVIILEVSILVITLLILNTSSYLVSKIFNYRVKTLNIFLFLLITKLFTLPLQITFIYLFEKTEMYELLFIHNTILSLLIFFLFVYSPKFFYPNLKQIITAVVINLLLYNLFIISISILKFDKYQYQFENPIFSDKIFNEFDEKLAPLDSLTLDIPKTKYLIILRNEPTIVYSFSNDSLSSIFSNAVSEHRKSIMYETRLIEKLAKHKDIRKNLRFKRNKMLCDTLVAYLKTMENDFRNPVDTSYTYIVDKITLTTENNRYAGEIKQLTINPKLNTTYISYLKNKNDYYNSVTISNYPTYIVQLMLFPALKLIQ